MSEQHDDLSELHWKARKADKLCGVPHSSGNICTREADHTGNHVAHQSTSYESSVVILNEPLVWGADAHSHLAGLKVLLGIQSRCPSQHQGWWCSRHEGHKGDHLVNNHLTTSPVWWAESAAVREGVHIHASVAEQMLRTAAKAPLKEWVAVAPALMRDIANAKRIRDFLGDFIPLMQYEPIEVQRQALVAFAALKPVGSCGPAVQRAFQFIKRFDFSRYPADVQKRAFTVCLVIDSGFAERIHEDNISSLGRPLTTETKGVTK